MPNKSKSGKQRRDAFYFKAKIAGFRARSAFKLQQLNTKYEFLQQSRVCVDLCAAPGSWMQVAKKYMPLSCIIVGVDLYPIKPIPGTLSIVGDITTEKVRKELKATLKTWKADLVLHDGAPNVGQNWLHDAYQQNLLVLHAFKLACEMLQKGGYFVTKVFRSKDYFNLEYIFRKLFKKVEATKPAASRYESAEIFVVCQGYLDPDKIDPQFFSPKHVFQELNTVDPSTKVNLFKTNKSKPKAEGYPEGATTLYNKVSVSKFIEAANYTEILQDASELVFDDDSLIAHRLTTDSILEDCMDIKVLGRKELRNLLNWRKAIKEESKKKEETEKAEAAEVAVVAANKAAEEKSEVEQDEEELDKLQKEILELKTEQAQDDKRARKRKLKEKKKLEQKIRLQTAIPGDTGPTESAETGLFNLQHLSEVQNMDKVVDQSADVVLSESEDEMPTGPRRVRFNPEETILDKSGRFYVSKEDQERVEIQEDSDSEEEGLGIKGKRGKLVTGGDVGDDADNPHPLITDLVGDVRVEKRYRKAENWFSQDVFKDLETEVDEDYELEAAISKFKAQGGKMVVKEGTKIKTRKKKEAKGNESGYTSGSSETEVARDKPDTDSDESIDSDSDEDDIKAGPHMPRAALGGDGGTLANPQKRKKGAEDELDPVGLSLASKMIHSKKAKRDIMDAGWNRYMFGDEDDLPTWFSKDEEKHNRLQIQVEPADLRMYRDRAKDVNVRTIKKVVEAKARKQRRIKKQLEKARKKAENVTNNADMSEREKSMEVKKLYKKAMDPLKKKETKYVVMRKRNKATKPKGIKGPYKLVDRRLKKDVRGKKKAEAQKKKSGKGRKK